MADYFFFKTLQLKNSGCYPLKDYVETANTRQIIANPFHRLGKLLTVAASNQYAIICILQIITFDSYKKVKYYNPTKDE